MQNLSTLKEVPKPAETIPLMERLNALLVTTVQIRSWIDRAPTTNQGSQVVQQGWPDRSEDEEMDPYFQRREELSTEDGCILWGVKMVVPTQLSAKLVE